MMTLAFLATTPLLGAIGRQELPDTGCAAYLWNTGDRQLVAMASADPARLRIALDGKPVDLIRADQHGEGGYGLAATTDYRGDGVAVTLEIAVATRADLKDGAAVPQATLRLAASGRDEVIVPLAGLIGCRR